jgi:hypothetical protein
VKGEKSLKGVKGAAGNHRRGNFLSEFVKIEDIISSYSEEIHMKIVMRTVAVLLLISAGLAIAEVNSVSQKQADPNASKKIVSNLASPATSAKQNDETAKIQQQQQEINQLKIENSSQKEIIKVYEKMIKESNIEKYTTIISLVIAFLAVCVGPFVSYTIAKKQINASTVSLNRQQWINTLRDTIADFVSKSSMVYCLGLKHYADGQSVPRLEQLNLLSHKIVLSLNPNEDDHKKLSAIMNDIISYIVNSLKERKDTGATEVNPIIDEKKNELIGVAQKILKREWNRVKRGE